jgi:hypothetical protein
VISFRSFPYLGDISSVIFVIPIVLVFVVLVITIVLLLFFILVFIVYGNTRFN